MALANVAAIYAQRGKAVLTLDFDFEAPGLHRYFLKNKDADRATPVVQKPGVLNLFEALRTDLGRTFAPGQDLMAAEPQEKMRGMMRALLGSGEYTYKIPLKNPNVKPAGTVHVDFIAAARLDDTYPELVRTFDWQGFYDDYAEIFPAIVAGGHPDP